MTNFNVIFSIDPTGFDKDILEVVTIDSETCLYCLYDKENRFIKVVKHALESKGYDLRYYFQIMKIYSL